MATLENLDLNLIKVFYYIYQTQSVHLAAEKLHLSQSACSHSLARLRERLDDELFIRINGKMVATERALLLAESVLPAVNLLQSGLNNAVPFEPAIGQHQFIISGYDFSIWCVLPELNAYLARHYPNISVRVVQSSEQIPAEKLESGDVDLALGFDHAAEQSAHIGNAVWSSGRYCIAMDSQHKMADARKGLRIEDFLDYPHILVTPWNESRGIVDSALAKINKKRQVAMTLPSVLSAPYLLKNTPYFLAIPEVYIQTVSDSLGLIYREPPIAIPDFQIKLYWHKVREKEAKVSWLIQLLCRLSTQTA